MNQGELLDAFEAVIKIMPVRFDSHQFIKKFIYHFPSLYGKLLMKHNNVATAHGEIANILRNNSKELFLRELNEAENISKDIFDNLAKCATWSKF